MHGYLVTISIIVHCIVRVDLPVFFLNVFGFIFMTIHTFAPNQIAQSQWVIHLISELLFIHITFAIIVICSIFFIICFFDIIFNFISMY